MSYTRHIDSQPPPQRPARPKHESRERAQQKSRSHFYDTEEESSNNLNSYRENDEHCKRITLDFVRQTGAEMALADDILAGKWIPVRL